MKIGILGSGIVGQTLADGFIKHGHQVMIGSRDESKLSKWKSEAGNNGSTGSFSDTAAFGEIVILAAKGTVAMEVIKLAGAEKLEGKTVIDASNPIADSEPKDGVLNFFTNLKTSLMEQLQKAFPKINFVKAFNSVGNAFMVNPDFNGIKPTMFICGNDEKQKRRYQKL